MIEDGIGVCRCLFNCSFEENKVKKITNINFQKSLFFVFIIQRFVDQMVLSIEIYVK